jgi:hypothetical protein
MSRRSRWFIGMSLGVAATGCGPARAANCRSDSECKTDTTTAAWCVESKCVECRGDDDCQLPKMCGQDHTCFLLH